MEISFDLMNDPIENSAFKRWPLPKYGPKMMASLQKSLKSGHVKMVIDNTASLGWSSIIRPRIDDHRYYGLVRMVINNTASL